MLRDQEEQGKRDEGEVKQEDPELGERSRRIKKKMESLRNKGRGDLNAGITNVTLKMPY